MKYGIVGSRRRKDRQTVVDFIKSLEATDIVISGGCKGVDSWAVEEATQRGLKVIEYLPDFEGCNGYYFDRVRAYYARNKQIAENSDILVALVSYDRTGGTENTIKHALKANKTVIIL